MLNRFTEGELKMDLADNIQALTDDQMSGNTGGVCSGAFFEYQVKVGDCLSVIAKRYGTTVEALCRFNKIGNPDKLIAGSRIFVPYTKPQ